jgi:hypothetical protein
MSATKGRKTTIHACGSSPAGAVVSHVATGQKPIHPVNITIYSNGKLQEDSFKMVLINLIAIAIHSYIDP